MRTAKKRDPVAVGATVFVVALLAIGLLEMWEAMTETDDFSLAIVMLVLAGVGAIVASKKSNSADE